MYVDVGDADCWPSAIPGLGNDFLLLDGREAAQARARPWGLSRETCSGSAIAAFGGGLVERRDPALRRNRGGELRIADLQCRCSEAEMCGNGIQLFLMAAFLADKRWRHSGAALAGGNPGRRDRAGTARRRQRAR